MTNSYRKNLIGIWLIVLGLEGILASLYVFNIPSMQKNAVLFGFSQMRLILGGGFLLFSMFLLVVAGLVMIDKFDLTIWIQKSNEYLASGDHLFYTVSAALFLQIFGIMSLLLFHSTLIPGSPTLQILFLRAQSIIVWFIVALAETVIVLFLLFSEWKRTLCRTTSEDIRKVILKGMLAIAVLLQWVIHGFMIDAFSTIPSWYWPFFIRPISNPELVILVLLSTFAILMIVNRAGISLGKRIILLVFLGFWIQFAMWLIQGGGIAALQSFYLDKGRAVYHVAVSDPHFQLSRIFHYDFFPESSYFLRTKPPGYLLIYAILAKPLTPNFIEYTTEQNAALLLQRISYIFPFIAALTIPLIIWFSQRTYKNITNALSAGIVYIFFPSTILFVFQLDQVLVPSLFIGAVLLWRLTLDKRGIARGFLFGFYIYICLFISFSLSALAVFLGIMFIIDVAKAIDSNNRRALMITAFFTLLGFILAHTIFRVAFDYDFLSQFRGSLVYHDISKGIIDASSDRLESILLNMIELGLWIGLPLVVLILSQLFDSCRRLLSRSTRSIDELFLPFGFTIIALLLFGKTEGEVARLWMFLLPIATIFVVDQLDQLFSNSVRGVYYLVPVQFITAYLIFQNQFPWM